MAIHLYYQSGTVFAFNYLIEKTFHFSPSSKPMGKTIGFLIFDKPFILG